ncbi:MAG: HEPN domain-containing protein [Planctomycetes bacterium]|nr:HEPN domain-containing protein [Planctomycetota bacterium]MBM4084133.1 HEPN domain-containing protein [Planctomycetota bacterium]
MNTREDGEKLIAEARRILERDVQGALKESDHNFVVRRAQEVVELVLKGALKLLGTDYPKAHDVAPVLVREVRAKSLPCAERDLERIEQVSFWLAQARGPSFYFEKEYGQAEAQQAAADAAWVVQQISLLADRILPHGHS